MSARQKIISAARFIENDWFEIISAAGLFIPCILDPAIYTFKVNQSKELAPSDKKLMVQQQWVHHGFNLLMEGVSFLGFRVAAKRWLCKSAVFMQILTRLLKQQPSADFVIKSAPLVGVCVFKSLIRPFAMFRAALKLDPKKDETPKGLHLPTLQTSERKIAPSSASIPTVHHNLSNILHPTPSLQGTPKPLYYNPFPSVGGVVAHF